MKLTIQVSDAEAGYEVEEGHVVEVVATGGDGHVDLQVYHDGRSVNDDSLSPLTYRRAWERVYGVATEQRQAFMDAILQDAARFRER